MPPPERRAEDECGFDVVGLGALNVDAIVCEPAGEHPVEHCETPTTLAENLERWNAAGRPSTLSLGGSAFNTMAMLAQLRGPLRLGMLGISADAAYGATESHAARLQALGIADRTKRSTGRPGLCVAYTSKQGRRLYPAPEANLEIADYLRGDAAPRAAVAGARVLHLTSLLEDPDVPGSVEVTKAVASFVEEVKHDNPDLILSFDPGWAWVDGLPTLPGLQRIYESADVVYLSPREKDVLGPVDVKAGAVVILKPTDQIDVRTGGMKLLHVPRVFETDVVDPIGAGDALAAGVLAALGEDRTLMEGCELGLRIAALRIAAVGDGGHADLQAALGEVWQDRTAVPPRQRRRGRARRLRRSGAPGILKVRGALRRGWRSSR